jgi:hypothetical protein
LSHGYINFSFYVPPSPPEEFRSVKFGDAGTYEIHVGLPGSFAFMAPEK